MGPVAHRADYGDARWGCCDDGLRVDEHTGPTGTPTLNLLRVILILVCLIGVIGLLLVALHGLESGIWAAAYLWLGALDSPLHALLFSVDSMTTRGASGLTLPSHWQMMGALEAVDGMLLFGVSTAFVFAVIQAYWSMLAEHLRPGKS